MNDFQANIFDYKDYRTYLEEVFRLRKQGNHRYSYNLWAKRLGLKNNTSLLKIIKGQRNAGKDIATKLCQDLNLNGTQKEYFLSLIRLEKASEDPELQEILSTKLRGLNRKQKFRLANVTELKAISFWYSYVIRQMTKITALKNDPKEIKSRLIFKVAVEDIKSILEQLLELGLLEKEGSFLKRADNRINTSDDVASLGLKRLHTKTLELAKQALVQIPPKEREISSLTLACRKEDIVKAKERIREFQDAFDAEFSTDNPNTVYQLQTQFFPMTKGYEGDLS